MSATVAKSTTAKSKTSAVSERAAREARQATKKVPRKSKAAIEALDAAAALKRNAEAAEPKPVPAPVAETPLQVESENPQRTAEVEKALSLGIKLADNEFLTKPKGLPEGARINKIVRRNGDKLKRPVYRVELPAEEPKKLSEISTSKSRKGAGKVDSEQRAKAWAGQKVGGDRATSLLDKLKKGTRSKPILAAKELSDNERHIARRLFAQGQIQRDKFEQGIGYFSS